VSRRNAAGGSARESLDRCAGNRCGLGGERAEEPVGARAAGPLGELADLCEHLARGGDNAALEPECPGLAHARERRRYLRQSLGDDLPVGGCLGRHQVEDRACSLDVACNGTDRTQVLAAVVRHDLALERLAQHAGCETIVVSRGGEGRQFGQHLARMGLAGRVTGG
jgi:hypothetical protein